MNNSNSHKELLNTIANRCVDSEIANKTVNLVHKLCLERSLNFDKVAEEVKRVVDKTETINSMYNFIKAVVSKLDPNKFGNGSVDYVPNTQPFINDLREKGIVVSCDDSAWLNVVWKHIVNFKEVDIHECMALNHKIIAYMIKHNDTSFETYKTLLKKSKTLERYEINWGLLEVSVEMCITNWNKCCDDLEGKD